MPNLPGIKNDGGSDSRFFTTQKKGELHELRMELHSTDRTTKVDAVKKVIASMTVGKDVSSLFTDVLNCVQTGNIELKKVRFLSLWFSWIVFYFFGLFDSPNFNFHLNSIFVISWFISTSSITPKVNQN
jgi:hypothetical protein